jgi:hypothetical protein
MACHEVAALRLGLMTLLGHEDDNERQHELAELGPMAHEKGPLQSLTQSTNWREIQEAFDQSLADLESRVARMETDDPKLPYYRSLLVLSKKTDMQLKNLGHQLQSFYQNLEEIHDYMHEIYPVEDDAGDQQKGGG